MSLRQESTIEIAKIQTRITSSCRTPPPFSHSNLLLKLVSYFHAFLSLLQELARHLKQFSWLASTKGNIKKTIATVQVRVISAAQNREEWMLCLASSLYYHLSQAMDFSSSIYFSVSSCSQQNCSSRWEVKLIASQDLSSCNGQPLASTGEVKKEGPTAWCITRVLHRISKFGINPFRDL